MAKIEVGKYYVDGEGFYKCIGKEEDNINEYVRMDAVIIRHKGLSYYENILFVEEACERRLVECAEESYNFALDQTISVYQKLDAYNTKLLRLLWANKEK